MNIRNLCRNRHVLCDGLVFNHSFYDFLLDSGSLVTAAELVNNSPTKDKSSLKHLSPTSSNGRNSLNNMVSI